MIKQFRRFTVENFSFLPRIYMKISRYFMKWKEVKSAYCDLDVKRKDGIDMVAVVGVNKYSKWFISKICKTPVIFWGGAEIDSSMYNEKTELRPLEELLYEDLDRLLIYVFEECKSIKTISYLHDMGIDDSHIIIVGEDYSRGSKLFDAYDCQLGLCWSSKYQGFEVFEKDSYAEKPYTIVTLGGSTTDPYMANIISWSEYLFYYLSEMGIEVRVICGGVGSFVVSQELNKLVRDVIELEPDLVISYSGVNDLLSTVYHFQEHPFTIRYQKDFITRCIEKRLLANELQTNFELITELTMGPVYNKPIWQHWIECERKMHGICREFGIKFIGCLQPYSSEMFMKRTGNSSDLYEETKKYISSSGWDWLIDLTDIFENETNIFFDHVHVYEKGNRLIAKRMMTYILPEMQRRVH